MTRPRWSTRTRRCRMPECDALLPPYPRFGLCPSCWAAGKWGAAVAFVVSLVGHVIWEWVK